MKASGLPLTAEKTLAALLEDNTVTSWKVSAEASSTVFILRLKPVDSTLSTNMADPVLNRSTKVQYKKKSPCEIRRDQERAKNHRITRESAKTNRDCGVDMKEQCEVNTQVKNHSSQITTKNNAKITSNSILIILNTELIVSNFGHLLIIYWH